MNATNNLKKIRDLLLLRLGKLSAHAQQDVRFVERFSIISISQLNNFLRSYVISLRTGAWDSSGNRVGLAVGYSTNDDLIDQMVKFGFRSKWKPGQVGLWHENQEPAYHTPRVLINIINGIMPSNRAVILSALTDSWKIDVLRNVRNYFAHRCRATETAAIAAVKANYSVHGVRADKILLENDPSIGMTILEDIVHYITDFSTNIT